MGALSTTRKQSSVGQDYQANCSRKRGAFPWLGWDSTFVGVSSLVHVSSSVATNRFRFVALA